MRKVIFSVLGVLFVSLIAFVAYEGHQARQEALCDCLWSAASEGMNDQIPGCLANGADINCDDGKPLKAALVMGHYDTAAILRKLGAKDKP